MTAPFPFVKRCHVVQLTGGWRAAPPPPAASSTAPESSVRLTPDSIVKTARQRVVIHAISEQAAGSYHRLGFDSSPFEPMTLMVTISDLRAA
jgi:hypothetical protein